jgi:hypothetical protein
MFHTFSQLFLQPKQSTLMNVIYQFWCAFFTQRSEELGILCVHPPTYSNLKITQWIEVKCGIACGANEGTILKDAG